MGNLNKQDLDNYITGHWGEDQIADDEPDFGAILHEADEALGRLVRESAVLRIGYFADPNDALRLVAAEITYHTPTCYESPDPWGNCICDQQARMIAIINALKAAIEAHAAVQDA